MNSARIPLRDFYDPASISRASIKSESNKYGDEIISSYFLSEVHRK